MLHHFAWCRQALKNFFKCAPAQAKTGSTSRRWTKKSTTAVVVVVVGGGPTLPQKRERDRAVATTLHPSFSNTHPG